MTLPTQSRRRLSHRLTPILLAFFALGAAAADTPVKVPVNTLDGWTALSYRNIAANEVSASTDGLRIDVDSSAGPLVYRLPQATPVHGFMVRARWSGAIQLPENAAQGDKGADDFVLRFGLVEAGEETLNWFQRRFAADWILTLYDLAPDDSGIEKIDFYSTTQQPALLGRDRTHPLSELLHESWIKLLEQPGEFELTRTFDQPVQTLGLWISSDGDDTSSSFQLEILEIELR